MKRRQGLQGLILLPLAPVVGLVPRQATGQPAGPPASVPPWQSWVDRSPVRPHGLVLDVSELVENGHDVPVRVRVDSPMRGPERVLALTIWAPANPEPLVLEVEFTEHSPIAAVAARMRLATSQTITALARMADGTVRRADVRVVVALAACVEGGA